MSVDDNETNSNHSQQVTICQNRVVEKTKSKKLTDNERDVIIALAVSDWSNSQISQYLNRDEKTVGRAVRKLQGTIERQKIDLMARIEGKAIEKALDGKGDAQLLKFLLEKRRPTTYGTKIQVTHSEPNKITIRGYDGQLLETIDKPGDNDSK
jgi:IS30 family transposase